MKAFLERRHAPVDSTLALVLTTVLALVAAFILAGLLFIPFGASPLSAFGSLFAEAFGSLRGFSQTLVQATPLILIAQATIVIWRGGLGYIGFEGCFLVGAAAASYVALGGTPQGMFIMLPVWAFWPVVIVAAFAAGALWGWHGRHHARALWWQRCADLPDGELCGGIPDSVSGFRPDACHR